MLIVSIVGYWLFKIAGILGFVFLVWKGHVPCAILLLLIIASIDFHAKINHKGE